MYHFLQLHVSHFLLSSGPSEGENNVILSHAESSFRIITNYGLVMLRLCRCWLDPLGWLVLEDCQNRLSP